MIRNDAPLERDADALVGVLLEGGSVPWTEAIRSLVDGASDGLDHLGELSTEGSVRLDGARDQLELERRQSRPDQEIPKCDERRSQQTARPESSETRKLFKTFL